VLVTHGDLLCVKDTQYQQFRHFVRNPKNQAEFLARPLDERRSIASRTRTGTQASMLEKDEFIMDADADEVTRVMRAHGVRTLIHGHTHRPGDHRWDQDGVPMRRIVLGDWYGGNEVLWWTPEGGRLVSAEALIAGFNA
jgi:UDP-2,3-diacylglucosamine hydrolase